MASAAAAPPRMLMKLLLKASILMIRCTLTKEVDTEQGCTPGKEPSTCTALLACRVLEVQGHKAAQSSHTPNDGRWHHMSRTKKAGLCTVRIPAAAWRGCSHQHCG